LYLTVRELVGEVYSPDACAGTNIEDALGILQGREEEMVAIGDAEEVVLEVEPVGFPLICLLARWSTGFDGARNAHLVVGKDVLPVLVGWRWSARPEQPNSSYKACLRLEDKSSSHSP